MKMKVATDINAKVYLKYQNAGAIMGNVTRIPI